MIKTEHQIEENQEVSIGVDSDAINYILNSSFYSQERYQWLKPLIDKVLSDQLEKKEIAEFINEILSIKENDMKKNEQDSSIEEKSVEPSEDSITNIRKIQSIERACNIGLLDIKNPVNFNDGLNVFYGKNGAGKSSIYFALCKALGMDKNALLQMELDTA